MGIDKIVSRLEACLPQTCEPSLLDELVSEIKKTYSNSAEQIIETRQMHEKRKLLTDWVLNPENDVKVLIAFSGGKDSIALVFQILELGVKKEQIELWHHEVDGGGKNLWDWKCTPSYCQAFADAFGLKLLFSFREGGITKEILKGRNEKKPDGSWKPELSGGVYFQNEAGGEYHKNEFAGKPNERGMFPAVAADLQTRWCSSHVKISVMSQAINNLPRFDKKNILILTGERRAESPARSKYTEIEIYGNAEKRGLEQDKHKPKFNTKRTAIVWRSVIDWSNEQVWDIMKKYKVQPHPSYELGWSRCSCQLCIFNSKNIWATINKISPEKVKEINDIEKRTGHTLYNGGDIFQQKVSQGQLIAPDEIIEKWAKIATSEFTAPIIVEEWNMPLGALSTENSGAV
jgi:3'-phosphoadenosine 5'-phosphosulfate sulfotransferase (PAPS reductase)/FAD synthetase